MKVPAALSIATSLAIALATGASAQDATAEGVQAELTGGAVLGVAAANVAAGDGNQQANVGLIAMGEKGLSIGSVAQTTSRPAAAAQTASAQSGIADGAFGGSSGWIATNIAAGSANQQANIAAIAIGVSGQALTADMLSQTRAPSTKEDVVKIGDKPADLATHIGDGAFAGSSGLVQVNVAAGDGNTSANVFGLSIAEP
jgi:hypothetical protein